MTVTVTIHRGTNQIGGTCIELRNAKGERLILDAMRGDHTLFTTAEGIERLWALSMPLLEAPPPVRLRRWWRAVTRT